MSLCGPFVLLFCIFVVLSLLVLSLTVLFLFVAVFSIFCNVIVFCGNFACVLSCFASHSVELSGVAECIHPSIIFPAFPLRVTGDTVDRWPGGQV